MIDYVVEVSRCAKIHHDSLHGANISPSAYVKYNVSRDLFCFISGFFHSRAGRTAWSKITYMIGGSNGDELLIRMRLWEVSLIKLVQEISVSKNLAVQGTVG
jgi:hypothetical protein